MQVAARDNRSKIIYREVFEATKDMLAKTDFKRDLCGAFTVSIEIKTRFIKILLAALERQGIRPTNHNVYLP